MSRIDDIFGKTYSSVSSNSNRPDHLNSDQYPAFSASLESDYLQMLLTNTFENTYYIKQDDLITKALVMHQNMLAKDPQFMARAIMFARTTGYNRTQPLMGLVYLTTHEDISIKRLARRIFPAVVRTPNDLLSFVTMAGHVRTGKGLGRSVKTMINMWLNNMSEYHTLKYGGKRTMRLVCNRCGHEFAKAKIKNSRCPNCRTYTTFSVKTVWSLRDVLRVSRPVPEDDKHNYMFKYAIHGVDQETRREMMLALPQIKAVEALKTAANSTSLSPLRREEIILDSIKEGKLPHEVVTGIISPSRKTWEHLMRTMPALALLRNLNTLSRHSVFDNPENIQYVSDRFNDIEAISKAMLWPGQILTAHQYFEGPAAIKDAIKDLAETSAKCIPPILGSNAIFIDISGSMMHQDHVGFKQQASILGALLLANSKWASLWCFDSKLHYPNISSRDSIITNAEKLARLSGGATDIGQCITHLMGTLPDASFRNGGYAANVPAFAKKRRPVKVDNIIILTDEHQNTGSPVVQEFREYRKTVNPDAKLFIISVAPYKDRVAPNNEIGVYYIFGWSENILKYINHTIRGYAGLVDSVRNEQLPKQDKKYYTGKTDYRQGRN